MRGEDRARSMRVAVDLGDHGVEVGEALLVAQLGHELELDALSVEVAVEIEEMCFEQGLVPRLATAGQRESPAPETRTAKMPPTGARP